MCKNIDCESDKVTLSDLNLLTILLARNIYIHRTTIDIHQIQKSNHIRISQQSTHAAGNDLSIWCGCYIFVNANVYQIQEGDMCA